MRILKAQKWKKFGKHPGSVNITMVREFYSNLTLDEQLVVVVRGKEIDISPMAINKYFKVREPKDFHTTFAETDDNETYSGIL